MPPARGEGHGLPACTIPRWQMRAVPLPPCLPDPATAQDFITDRTLHLLPRPGRNGSEADLQASGRPANSVQQLSQTAHSGSPLLASGARAGTLQYLPSGAGDDVRPGSAQKAGPRGNRGCMHSLPQGPWLHSEPAADQYADETLQSVPRPEVGPTASDGKRRYRSHHKPGGRLLQLP